MEKEKVAVAAVALLLILAVVYLALKPAGKPDLVATASIFPSQPSAGDVVEFTITISNKGSATATDAAVDLEINNFSVAQKSVTLAPGESEEILLSWFAGEEGTASVRINANKGNLIEEENLGDSVLSMQIPVKAADEIDLFASLPDENITSAYEFGAGRGGMNQIAGILASSEGSNSQLYQSLFNKFGEAHLGILHYAGGAEAAFMYSSAALTNSEMLNSFRLISGEFIGETYETNKEIAGRNVTIITSKDALVTLCLWRDGGWARTLMFKRYFHEISVGNMTFGDSRTCEDFIGQQYNSSAALEKLKGVDDLSSAVPDTGAMLLEMRAKQGADALYVRGFADENSAFILTLSSSYSAVRPECAGQVIAQDNKTICYVSEASLLGTVDAEGFMRRQEGIEIGVFILPFQSTDMGLARETAMAMVKSVTYPGIPEYDWSGQWQAQMSDCRFPSGLWCTPPTAENTTISVNLTQAQGHPFRVNGLYCTQQESLSEFVNISFAQPPEAQANETISLSFPCYIIPGEPLSGEIWFLRAQLFVNYTDLATNETMLSTGRLLISSTPGTG